MVDAMVYAEDISWAKQLASASKLFGNAVLITTTAKETKEFSRYYKKVYVIKVKVFEPLSISKVIEKVLSEEKPNVFVFPCTNKGRMLSGLIAGKLGLIPITDVIGISKSGKKFMLTKLTFGGNAKVDIEIELPFIICIAAGSFKEAEAGEVGEVKELEVPKAELEVDFEPRKMEGVSPEKAEIVVGAGRGIKKKEDLNLVKELAEILGGAWSVTRPLAADYSWTDNWIGISGLIINPKVYIAVGISGQPHHMMGVRGSKTIVAINNDESAPIFEESDYGVVGDLYKVLPVLIRKLKEQRGR